MIYPSAAGLRYNAKGYTGRLVVRGPREGVDDRGVIQSSRVRYLATAGYRVTTSNFWYAFHCWCYSWIFARVPRYRRG